MEKKKTKKINRKSSSIKKYNDNLDFLVSDNFIIWWDNRFNKTEMAIDILRWSEYSVIKLLEYGFDKPKDFDTHRINIFIRQEGGDIDIIPDEGQNYNYVSTYRNGRKHIEIHRFRLKIYDFISRFFVRKQRLRYRTYFEVLNNIRL